MQKPLFLNNKDPYKILEVDRNATKEEIKRSFRKLAQKYHPDKEGGDPEKFKEINWAYEILSDDEKRKQYDTYGQTFDNVDSNFSGFSDFDFSNFVGFSDLGDIFSDFFESAFSRTNRRYSKKVTPKDIRIGIEISFEDSYFGAKKEISFEKIKTCDECSGTGARGSKFKKCSDCSGTGQKVTQRRTPFGIFQSATICENCNGEGTIPEDVCNKCKGRGEIKTKETITIKIPQGVDDGEVLRVRGEGNSNRYGSGDLLIEVSVKRHESIKRKGYDLFLNISVPFTKMVLGGKEYIDFLGGERIKFDIPPKTEDGEILRLKGRGIKRDGKSGDLYLKLSVKIPKNLDKETKEMLEKLRPKLENN